MLHQDCRSDENSVTSRQGPGFRHRSGDAPYSSGQKKLFMPATRTTTPKRVLTTQIAKDVF